MRFYVYAISPTDWWEGTMSVNEWLRLPGAPTTIEERIHLWGQAEAAVRRHGLWEDDLRDSEGYWPKVSVVPSGESSMHELFMWKMNNNGTTIVVTPVELPWLQDFYEHEPIVVDRNKALDAAGMELLRFRS